MTSLLGPNSSSAFVDIITNHAQNLSITSSQFAELLSRGSATFSETCLMAMIHESAHQWCFSSLVGDAFALRAMSAYWKMQRHTSELISSIACSTTEDAIKRFLKYRSDFVESRGLDAWYENEGVGFDLARDTFGKALVKGQIALGEKSIEDRATLEHLEYARTLLIPITEGIAIYAELDASTFRSAAIPPPFFNLLQLSDEAKADFPMFLETMRRSKDGLARRLSYLTLPFALIGGGHLVGYAFVRSLALKKGTVTDGDFVAAVRATFFEDPILANLILDDQLSTREFEQQFRERVSELLVTLPDNIREIRTDERGDGTESNMGIAGNYLTSAVLRVYLESAASDETTLTVLERLVNGFGYFGVQPAGKFVKMPEKVHSWSEVLALSLIGRRYACLGTLDVGLSITLSRKGLLKKKDIAIITISVDDNPLLAFEVDSQASSLVKVDDGRATVAVYIGESASGLLFSLSVNGVCIGSVLRSNSGICFFDRYELPMSAPEAAIVLLTALESGMVLIPTGDAGDRAREVWFPLLAQQSCKWLRTVSKAGGCELPSDLQSLTCGVLELFDGDGRRLVSWISEGN